MVLASEVVRLLKLLLVNDVVSSLPGHVAHNCDLGVGRLAVLLRRRHHAKTARAALHVC